MTSHPNIKIGASACLLGRAVRHDGGHTRSRYITDTLGRHFELLPFCPEVAAGLGTPRPAIQLRQTDAGIRVVGTRDPDFDVTDAMRTASSNAIPGMTELSGYILKKDSPSCGMERVRIYKGNNQPPERVGRGIFAAQLMRAFPELPVEEEGRLNDPVLRENFLARVFTYHQWHALTREGLTVARFQKFHARHKYTLLAHDEVTYRTLGPVVAGANRRNLGEIAQRYFSTFMEALKKPATRKRHCNVLMHIMGYFKHDLSREHKQEFLGLLERYRLGELPLIVPVTLLRHHLLDTEVPYISTQSYLQPYPEDLALMNQL